MLSFISMISTACSGVFNAARMSRSRSWVSGRAGLTPCCSYAIAVASTAPIQIGRYRSPSTSRSSTIGWLLGSSTRTPTTLSSRTVASATLDHQRPQLHGTRATRRLPICVSAAQHLPQALAYERAVQLRAERGQLVHSLQRLLSSPRGALPRQRRDELSQ